MSYQVGAINNGFVPTGGQGRVHAPGLEKRMENQDARISQGAASGSLTQEETDGIGSSQKEYEETLQQFKANDGKVGPKERMLLHQQLNDISALIYGDKHN